MYFSGRGAEPGTHALIIGVGGYRHLPHGAGRTVSDPSLFSGIGQLTSPPLSAVALADWLMNAQDRTWTAPLASVDLLVSPHPAFPEMGKGTTEPTREHVQAAYDAWRERVSAHPHNIALFYFCGHGIREEARQLLLTSDFGQSENQPFHGAFELEETRAASNAGAPATQCFFVDACSTSVPWMMKYHSPNVPGLAAAPRRQHSAPNTATLLASRPNRAAEAHRQEVSFFTQALLKAFDGGAARRGEVLGDWVVSTNRLFSATQILVHAARGDTLQELEQQASAGDAVLWQLAGSPPVEFTVACRPNAAHRRASLACTPAGQPLLRKERRVPTEEPFRVESSAGSHHFHATFEENCYTEIDESADVIPPGAAIQLQAH